MILLHGTKLSLALAVPLCVGLIVLAEPLIYGWVGARFAASVRPTQILLGVVLIRIGTASANLILRGAGEHRLLTLTNGATAIVNVILSIVLIGPFELVGVALGTLIPVTGSAALVLYPAACRRVNLPISRPLTKAFWPAIWPGVAMIGALKLLEQTPPSGLIAVGVHLAVAGGVYAGLFVGVAIDAEERRFYWTKVRSLLDRRGRGSVAA